MMPESDILPAPALAPHERHAPARREDMERFAERLRQNPAEARAFFQSAGIIDANGELAPWYRDAKQIHDHEVPQ